MKELVKQEIMNAMNAVLNFQQIMMLEKVIHQSFHNVEINLQNKENQNFTDSNQSILSLFISSKKVEGCSEKSLKYYSSTIDTLLLKLKKNITNISTNDLRFYLSDYQEIRKSSKVTIDNIRRIFSSFFSWLEDEDYILKSPVRRIHKIKTPRIIKEILSDEEIEVLRDNCKEIRDLTLIEILISTGIRVGELVKINRKDINFHERSCIVTGKGNKEREVYFDARSKIHLTQYLKSRTDDNEALFVSLSKPHQRLSIGGVENVLRKLGLKTKINKVHPHKF